MLSSWSNTAWHSIPRKNLVKYLSIVISSIFLFGCAQGKIDIIDKEGKVVGNCSANFYFHWYGAQHSVNYLLYICAKEYIDKGFKVSDEAILVNDYTIPKPPEGKAWNKKIAKQQFADDLISEEKLGYILAHVEHHYWEKLNKAKDDLSRSNCSS